MDFHDLQTKHPCFIYRQFQYQLQAQNLLAQFTYQLENGPTFTHQVTFYQVDEELFHVQDQQLLDQLVFNLGLVEMFSYWKLAASPVVKIDCGGLNSAQIDFWHQLCLNGMGEYLFVNQIDNLWGPAALQFISATTDGSRAQTAVRQHQGRRSALNLGGGKDSAVVLSAFMPSSEDFVNLIIQPASPAATAMAKLSRRPAHFVSRQFDPQLFELNDHGYLNGHVPFSASVAFINALASVVYDYDFAVVGNEKSADECSLWWDKKPINHQYSKSTKFEQDFRDYSKKYLINNFEYFSFIRPLSELKIAQLFCTNPVFYPIFRSCNRSQKKYQWCEHCAKCLFVFLTLSPFMEQSTLTHDIFSHNLFDDQSLLTDLEKMVGLQPAKPLECVGTVREARAALALTIAKYQYSQQPLPILLQTISDQVTPTELAHWRQEAQALLAQLEPHHFLPLWANDLLRGIIAASDAHPNPTT